MEIKIDKKNGVIIARGLVRLNNEQDGHYKPLKVVCRAQNDDVFDEKFGKDFIKKKFKTRATQIKIDELDKWLKRIKRFENELLIERGKLADTLNYRQQRLQEAHDNHFN